MAMLTTPLSARFHIANRKAFAKAVGDSAVAVIDTAGPLARGDLEYPYRPDPNFFYLTGIAEPEAVLVIVPGHSNPGARELLFISGTSEHVGLWEGERLTPEAAAKISGIKTVLPLSELDFYLGRLLQNFQTVYLNADEALGPGPNTPAARRARAWRESLPLHQLCSALPALGRQRIIKDPVEIDQIRRAVAVTAAGLGAAWRILKPGRHEYELEAEIAGEFIRLGSDHSFSPIVAAGQHATIIHYMKNAGRVGTRDLVLFDVGGLSNFYAADISRTVPASGKFTDRQRAVYEAVLRAQTAGIKACKPGATILSADEHMRTVLTEEVKKLGLKGSLHDYYPHISHHLGLDVHDTGDPRTKLAPGMVVTCEPGLYLREEGIGVRLEDDIVITESGNEVLSAGIPSSPAELERIVQGGKS